MSDKRVVQVSLVSVTFAHVLPDVRASNLQLAVGVVWWSRSTRR